MVIPWDQVLKALGVGAEIDLEKKKFKIKLFNITIGPFSYWHLKELQDDQRAIRDTLEQCFIGRRAMWEELAAEGVDYTIRSLDEAEKFLNRLEQQCVSRGSPTHTILASLLARWKERTLLAKERLLDALDEERNPANTGIDSSARDALKPTLADYRKETYPIVEALLHLCRDDKTKQQAETMLKRGKEILIRDYMVSWDDVQGPELVKATRRTTRPRR